MNFRGAIGYLQGMIAEPPGQTPEGARDPGWCCTEHALIFALALGRTGLEPKIAEGAVVVRAGGLLHEWVKPHWFVLVEQEVYDSSIRSAGLEGMFPDAYPDVRASVSTEEIGIEVDRDGAWYSYSERHDPEDHSATVSETPYGRWLTSQSIDHKEFWRAASTIAAGILGGGLAPPDAKADRLAEVRQTLAIARALG